MGFFNITPKNKKEQQAYDAEKNKAMKAYQTEKNRAHLEHVKAQARFDALPRHERARQRLAKGFGALKMGASRLKALDAKLDARARAQGSTGGVITQGYGMDLKTAASTPPLLQQSLQRDQAGGYSGGYIQQSLRGPQGGGLIQQSLHADIMPKEHMRKKKKR